MSDTAFWPEPLLCQRLDDATLTRAYAETQPWQRVCIKQALAFAHAAYSECADATLHRREDSATGFCLTTHSRPCAWAVALISPAYAAPTRLATALLCAVLAKVPYIGVFCVGGTPSASACVALELTGIEDVFTLSPDAAVAALRILSGKGIVLLLHTGELTPVREALDVTNIAVWEESRPPVLCIEPDAPHDRNTIVWCHPDAPLQTAGAIETTGPPSALCDALYTHTEHTTPYPPAPLCLLPGMEACWLHQGLSHTSFREYAVQAAVYPQRDGP